MGIAQSIKNSMKDSMEDNARTMMENQKKMQMQGTVHQIITHNHIMYI